MTENKWTCPHCNSRMLLWETPVDSSWGREQRYVCFHDECPYYVRGWTHMLEKYNQKASYRHSIVPATGKTAPLPVWSNNALLTGLVND